MNTIKATVMSVAVYASETWTLKKQDRDRLLAFEMKCYRRILRIKWGKRLRTKNCAAECDAGRTWCNRSWKGS